MPPAPHTPGLKPIFLGWNRPLLHLVAEYLSGEGQPRLLDLSGTVVVVPTSHSGRRLRERLAWLAAQDGGGVIPPGVYTPERLLRRFFPLGVSEPSPTDRIALWAALLREAGQNERGPLLSAAEASRGDPAGASAGDGEQRAEIGPLLTAAQRISQVQHLLGEAGLSMSDVAAPEGPYLAHLDEPARWAALARLECRFDDLLERHGLADSDRLRREAAEHAMPPPGWKRVLVAGVLDPLPLTVRLLERFSELLPVEVLVHAPLDAVSAFDEWGRPRPEHWSVACLDIEDASIRLVADCTQAATVSAEACLAAEGGAEQTALCVPAGDEIPVVVKELERAGLAAYDPGGRPLHLHRVVGLLKLLWDLLPVPTADAVAGLLRHPDYLRWLGSSDPRPLTPDPRFLLSALDDLRAEHLPATLADIESTLRARAASLGETSERDEGMAALVQACRTIRSHVDRLAKHSSIGKASLEILAEVYGGLTLAPSDADDRVFTVAAKELAKLLTDLDEGVVARLLEDPQDRIALARLQLSGLTFQPERESGAVDILGWLELPYEDAPNLVVCGMNDGAVPETVTVDPFLPDSLRKRLGLRTNDDRMARDACLLAAAAKSRKSSGRGAAVPTGNEGGCGDGRLLLLVEKTSPQGDPKRPSRLLFLCPDDQLPGRVMQLFGELSSQARPAPRSSIWKLRPRIAPTPKKLSVTSFAAYLACPFRFYLANVLRMEPVDDRADELDPMGFGILIHEAMQALGIHAALKHSTDVAEVRDFLRQSVLHQARQQFGNHLSPALIAQVEAASQRLSAAAAVHVQSVLDGWRIHAVEKRLDTCELVEGLKLSGRVDRIDRHERTGRYRILDYKTSDSPVSPATAHLGSAQDDTPEEARIELDGKEKAWTNLQLPLYRALLAGELGNDVEVGYFLLPKAVSQTRIELFAELTPKMVEAALECARGIARRITERKFWPPSRATLKGGLPELYGSEAGELDTDWLQRLLGRDS